MFNGLNTPIGMVVAANMVNAMTPHGNVTPSPMAVLGNAAAAMNMMNLMTEAAKPVQQPEAAARAPTPPPKPKVGFGGIPESELKRMEAEAAEAGPSLQLQREIQAIEAQKARDEERIRQYEAEQAAAKAAAPSRGWFHWAWKIDHGYTPMKTE